MAVNPIRVPDDTRSIHKIGEFIMSYQPYQNAFLSSLVNRIGRVLVTSKMWSNPWAVFKRGRLEFGETVEEIFANIAEPHSFDPAAAENEVFKREIPDVRAAFHSMNYQKFYKATISNDQLRQAFISYAELVDLIARIVDSLYTSMNLDEYLVMKYMLCRAALNGEIFTVTTPAITGTGADPAGAVVAYREMTNNLTFLKTTYNLAGVWNSTPVGDQVIIVANAPEAVIGVDVLANAFNLSQVDYIGNRVAIDSFSFDANDMARLKEIFANDPTFTEFNGTELKSLSKISAAKVSSDWFMVFDNYEQFTENYNGQGLYWQYFYHVWKTFSYSPFENAVVFTSEASEITSVTVSPASSNVAQGSSLQLNATVAGTGLIDKTVTWSISSDSDLKSGTAIDAGSGLLRIAADEVAETVITVTATAVNGKTGTSTITVVAAS